MLDLWAVLIPILLADVVNPVLFAFMVYAVGSDRPLTNAIAALLGHTIAYLAFGIALAMAFETITGWLSNPKPVDYWLGLLIGVLLIWVAWRARSGGEEQRREPESKRLTPPKAFGIGAVINIVGLPFALPYFAALDQILKDALSVAASAMVIAGYNLGYALPFLVIPVLALLLGERSRPILARINEKVDRASAVIMPVMLGLVGVALVADAVQFLATGEGLF
jgi:cytochrome c biogenesis protein CcdA